MKINALASGALMAVLAFATVDAKADAQMTFITIPTGWNPGDLLPATGAVFDVNGTTGLGSTFSGQVYAGTSAGSLTALGSSALFATSGGTPISSFNGFVIDGATLTLTGANPGAGFYQLKVWETSAGSSFEAASVVLGAKVGASGVTGINFGGTPVGGGTGTPAPNVSTFSSFSIATVAVPEPATIALGLFGAAGMLFRRRK